MSAVLLVMILVGAVIVHNASQDSARREIALAIVELPQELEVYGV